MQATAAQALALHIAYGSFCGGARHTPASRLACLCVSQRAQRVALPAPLQQRQRPAWKGTGAVAPSCLSGRQQNHKLRGARDTPVQLGPLPRSLPPYTTLSSQHLLVYRTGAQGASRIASLYRRTAS